MDAKQVTCLNESHGKTFSIYQADCVDFSQQMPDNSIDLSIYSPPFANLYIYSDSAADMGNCADYDEFCAQYGYLVREMLRLTKPGRLSCVHCIDIPLFKWKDGATALLDFPGKIIQLHTDAGWRFHSRITIWKDPVTEMQRTKAIGLLHKQLKKDSTKSRMGLPDYVLVFKKDGDNENEVAHTPEQFPVEMWQEWASPVWMTVRQTNVLNRQLGRGANDEKHICPLQLDVIERCVVLWSNPGDVVFSPFMGIGSEGFQSVKYRRKFIGTELKESYFKLAESYLKQAEAEQDTLFDE